MSSPRPESRRDLWVLGGTILALGVGEELWQAYIPAYIVALGGTGAAVGLFTSVRDLLDGLYQLPGGWLADRHGPRRAVKLFTLVALAGYAAYALAWDWPVVLVGLAGAMAWKAGAFPATFAVIGDAMPEGTRAAGFTVQSVAVRLPRVISAPVGGLMVGQLGLLGGLRAGMATSVGLAAAVLIAQHRWFPPDRPDGTPPAPAAPIGAIARSLPPALIRLLVADCLVRIGEAVAASFIILYVTSVREIPLAWYGALYGLQQFVALASYVPAAGAVRRVGARPLVAVSFACFALFPLGVLLLPGVAGLVLAFAVGGFREFGEPARKSTIVDYCPPNARGRGVGAYYTVRNLLVVPAGLAGGLIWQYSPGLVLAVAAIVSMSGLVAFLAMSGALERPPGGGAPS